MRQVLKVLQDLLELGDVMGVDVLGEMLVLKEENLRLGKENVSARISVERMAGLFE